jgi:hypothetical protein
LLCDGRRPPYRFEDEDTASLDLAHAGHKREQRGFSDAIGSDHSHHLLRRNIDGDVVQRDHGSVSML